MVVMWYESFSHLLHILVSFLSFQIFAHRIAVDMVFVRQQGILLSLRVLIMTPRQKMPVMQGASCILTGMRILLLCVNATTATLEHHVIQVSQSYYFTSLHIISSQPISPYFIGMC